MSVGRSMKTDIAGTTHIGGSVAGMIDRGGDKASVSKGLRDIMMAD